MTRKQIGGKAFDALARKLVQVPKKEVDKAIRKAQEKRKRRKN